MDYVWNTNLKISNGLIKSRQSKDRQYNGQKKDRQYNGQKKDRQYNSQREGQTIQ